MHKALKILIKFTVNGNNHQRNFNVRNHNYGSSGNFGHILTAEASINNSSIFKLNYDYSGQNFAMAMIIALMSHTRTNLPHVEYY